MTVDMINIAVVSNIIFEPYFLPLIRQRFGKEAKVSPIPYGEHNEPEYKFAITYSDFLVVWLNFEALFPDGWNALFSGVTQEVYFSAEVGALCEQLYSDLTDNAHAQILWFLFEDYFAQFKNVLGMIPLCDGLVNRINCELITRFSSVVFIDLKCIIAEAGIANAYDPKGKYHWNSPYSKTLIESVVSEIHKQYFIEKGITKKCLVLDCDNVLWGGILSEDGIEKLF